MNYIVYIYWCFFCVFDIGFGIKWFNLVEVWGWNGVGYLVGEFGGGGF